ncbi:MAG: class I SAM-dependent methyltransferase, partial [Pseudoclavibacter sp.]
STITGRVEKQLAKSGSEQRKDADALLAQVKEAQDRLLAASRAHTAEVQASITDVRAQGETHSNSLGSLEPSLRLHTEAITQIGKQAHDALDQLKNREQEGLNILAAASESRDLSRDLLKVVGNGQRDSEAQLQAIEPALRELSTKSDELKVGNRNIVNHLRKEGNIQMVLSRLEATERRLISSVEAGALTNADSLSTATARSIAELRMDLAGLHSELAQLSSRADHSDVRDSLAGAHETLDAILQLTHASRTDIEAFRPRLDRNEAELVKQVESLIHGEMRERLLEFQNELAQLSSRADHSDVRDSLAGAHETLDSILQATNATRTDLKSINPKVDQNGIEVVKQVEALIQLLSRVDTLTQRFPSSGGWAMTPDSLLLLSDLIRERKPRVIVELGSGSSTVWLGNFARDVGAELHSFEHLEEYRNATSRDLERFKLEDTVSLNLAELTDIEIDGETRRWYNPQAFEGLSEIDMLIVDGPPKSTGPEPRLPAFTMLREHLAPGALIVVDDLQREAETTMVRTWMQQDSGLIWTPWSASRTGVLEYTLS